MPSEVVRRDCKREACPKWIPLTKSANARYCSEDCSQKVRNARLLAKKKLSKKETNWEETASESSHRRKGGTYHRLVKDGHAQHIVDGSMTASHAAELLGVTIAAVSRAMGAYRVDIALDEQAAKWVMDPEVAALLPSADLDRLTELGPGASSTHEYKRLMKSVQKAFWKFEHRYFTIGSKAEEFIVKRFHRKILKALIVTRIHGERVLILTPPRHGKSEIVLRFVAWLIVMYPNIQVLWVASNSKLAVIMTRKLKGVFGHSKLMRDELLPPGKKFGDKDAPKWTEDEFILYTRTNHTLKSATFTAIGSNGTVAGRDADWIGIDDLEELKTVGTHSMRNKSRLKHAEIMERQEEHTGVCTIASRQHPDDIPNHLIGMDGDEVWKTLVFPAHDDACDLDPEIEADHVECMLMPEVRSYRWLMKMKREAETLGLPGRFPLRYLQKSVALEGIIFDIPLIREVCLDRSRGLGVPEGITGHMVAGLDPAPRGTQASFGWLWTETTTYMIDLEEASAGGVLGAVDVMKRWLDAYDLTDWVHEDNSGQIDAWSHVPEYRKLKYDSPINIMIATTGGNKHDPAFGISSMASWYHSGRINLPYGTPEARRKVNVLLRQLELWTSDGLTGKGKTDVKMASWLPFPRMQRWQYDTDDVELELVSEQSYPGIGRNNQAPWGYTNYPGG